MESDNPSYQCYAVFTYKAKMMGMGMGTGTDQKYGEGTLTIGSESLSFKPYKEPKLKGGFKGSLLKMLSGSNIQIYPHPVVQYRDVKELKPEKSKALGVYMHAPYTVNLHTGREMLAIPTMDTEMRLILIFDNTTFRDNVLGQLTSRWNPFKRTELEVGFGTTSPSKQPITDTRAASGDAAGFCTKCGAPYPEGQSFCGKCGNPLS